MKYQYHNLLDPDLYSQKTCARFVEIMHEPDIHTAANVKAEEIIATFPSADDLLSYLELTEKHTQIQFLKSGIVFPTFSVYSGVEPINLKFPIPATMTQISDLHMAGKCFAFMHCAMFVFFSTLAPHSRGEIIIGQDLKEDEADLGIYITGSSMKGNAFTSLTKLVKNKGSIGFQNMERRILRESNSTYPINKLFLIRNPEEMTNVLNCIPKVMQLNPELDERHCLINFAACLKALAYFNYAC